MLPHTSPPSAANSTFSTPSGQEIEFVETAVNVPLPGGGVSTALGSLPGLGVGFGGDGGRGAAGHPHFGGMPGGLPGGM